LKPHKTNKKEEREENKRKCGFHLVMNDGIKSDLTIPAAAILA